MFEAGLRRYIFVNVLKIMACCSGISGCPERRPSNSVQSGSDFGNVAQAFDLRLRLRRQFSWSGLLK